MLPVIIITGNIANCDPIHVFQSPKTIATTAKFFQRQKYFHDMRANTPLPRAVDILDQVRNSSKNSIKVQSGSEWISLGPHKPNGQYQCDLGRVNTLAINPSDTNHLVAGSASGGLWQSFNNAQSWELVDMTDFMSMGITDIEFAPSDNNVIYASTGDHAASFFGCFSIGLIKSTNTGKSWSITSLAYSLDENMIIPALAVDYNDENLLLTASNKGLFVTIDGGKSWRNIDSSEYYFDVIASPDVAGVFYASTFDVYGGAKVMKIQINDTIQVNELLHLPLASRIDLAISESNPNFVYAVAVNFNNSALLGIYYSDNSGETWKQLSIENDLVERQGTYNLFLAVSPTDKNHFAYGGVLMGQTFDFGKSWNVTNTGHWDYHDFIFTRSGTQYACNDGGIYRSYNQGETWDFVANGMSITQFYRVGAHPYNKDVAIGGSQDNHAMLFMYGDFFVILSGDGMESIFNPINPSIMYVSLQRGGLSTQFLGPKQPGLFVNKKYYAESSPWLMEMKWNPHSQNELFLGKYAVSINTLASDGNTRERFFKDFGDGYAITCIEFGKTTDSIMAVSSERYLQFTTNKGDSWDTIYETEGSFSDIKMINDSIVTCTISGYGVYPKVLEINAKSGIEKDLTFNLPNISVLTLDTLRGEILIGTDIGVYKLNTSVNRWEQFGTGLPNAIINELEYVEATGCLYAASWGRGLWKMDLCETEPLLMNYSGHISPCDNDSIVTFEVVNYDSTKQYIWHDGSNGRYHYYDFRDSTDTPVPYSVFVSEYGQSSCNASSDHIAYIRYQEPIMPWITNVDRIPGCQGRQLRLRARGLNDVKYSSIKWSNGVENQTEIAVVTEGNYSFIITMPNGCEYSSDSIWISFADLPPPPTIYRDGIFLKTNSKLQHRWTYNGEILKQSSGNSIVIEKPGLYTSQLIVGNNCQSELDSFYVEGANLKIGDKPYINIFPQPASSAITIDIFNCKSPSIIVKIFDIKGKEILQKSIGFSTPFRTITLDPGCLPIGIYYVQVIDREDLIYKRFVIYG